MKKLLFLVLCITVLACNFSSERNQNNTVKYLPSFHVLLLDSSTVLKSEQIPAGSPTVFIYFKTNCPHCREETIMILKNIRSLQGVNIYLLTYMSLGAIKQYNTEFDLTDYHNITIGKDLDYSFARAFQPKAVPYIAIYDGQKKLVRIYKGETSLDEILNAIHS